MKPEGRDPFEGWKIRLSEDCEVQDKLLAFNALGDDVLKLLWEQGLAPSVNAITSRNGTTVSSD